MVNVKSAATELGKLAAMKYFPPQAEKEARAAILQIVCEMAEENYQIEWLVRRMLTLYNEWPGLKETRALFCSRYRPKDGITAYSSVYISDESGGGFSRERIAEKPKLALPPGHTQTADRQMESMVHEAAAVMPKMPCGPYRKTPEDGRFKRILEALETPPHLRPELQPPAAPTPQMITQEDIDRAVEANRKKQEVKA